MFKNIPSHISARMKYLEQADQIDRKDGTPRQQRLRQIPPETGQFIARMLKNAPPGPVIEIGTSGGYSTLWLALACRSRGMKITTFEILPEKVKMAKETFELSKTTETIALIEGDALEYLVDIKNISFCFLDAEKEIYQDCYDLVIPRMCAGGIFIADNAINHASTLQPMIDYALGDQRVDGVVVPVGKGVLYCRKKD